MRLIVSFAALLATSGILSDANGQSAAVNANSVAPLLSSGFRVAAQPEWSLDLRAAIPPGPLNIVGAAKLRNGIVVAEAAIPRLVFYSRDRRLVRVTPIKAAKRSTARIYGLQRVSGDTIAILADGEGWTIGPDDAIPATLSFAEAYEPRRGRISTLFAVLSNGSSLWSVLDLVTQSRSHSKPFTDSVDLFLQSRTGETRRIKRVAALTIGNDSLGHQRQMWFYPHLAWAATNNYFYYGFGGDYLVTRINLLTGEESSWRRAWTPQKVTAANIDEFINGWSVNWNKGSDSIAVKAEMHQSPFAEFIPAFSQFVVSTAQELWVRTPNLIDAQAAGELNDIPLRASVWSVFSKEGQWLSEVTLPAGFKLTDAGPDYILGVQFSMKNGALSGRERNLVMYKYSRRQRPIGT